MKKKGLMKTTSTVFRLSAGMLAFLTSAYTVVGAQRSTLDGALGTQSYKIVTDKTKNEDNLYNFKAKKGTVVGSDGKEINVDCSTLEGLFDYEKDVSMRLAEESAVLLKNDNILPLSDVGDKGVTLLGSRSYGKEYMNDIMNMHILYLPDVAGTKFGGNMGSVAPGDLCVTIKDSLEENGIKVNQTVADAYDSYLEPEENRPDTVFTNGQYALNESNPTDLNLDSMKDSFGDTAIVTVGRPSSEGQYYLPGEEGKADPSEFDESTDVLGLSKDELATLQYARDNFKHVIVLINAVSMDLPELDEYADAVMWVGLPGPYGFEGIAKLLNGTLSPSGCLADTYATKAADALAMVNTQYTFQEGNGVTISEEYGDQYYEPELESIYTGYKYYESRYYDTVVNARNARASIGAADGADTWNYNDEVVWSYGYGMSYTDFKETPKITVDYDKQTVTAEVEVENTGDTYAGKHDVQLYAQVPYTEGGLEKSAVQLLGFAKTDILQPGEKQTVTITADFQDFASWDDELEHNGVTGGYVLDEGDYYFTTGNGANDALNNILAAQGYTKDSTDGYMTADGNSDVVTKTAMNRVEITESKSGEMLQNQLDNMDLTKQVDGVEDFSRSDWEANWPEECDNITPSADMKDALMNQVYTLNENGDPSSVKFGEDYGITYAELKPANGEKLDYNDPMLQKFVEQYDLGDAIAQIINGDSNSLGATTVSGKEKAQPYLYLDDGPNGYNSTTVKSGLSRIPESSPFYGANDPDYDKYESTALRTLPSGTNIGATWNPDLNEEAGEMMGQVSLWNGANILQGPGSNTHRNAYNSRNHEYYSEDGLHSGIMMDAFCKGAWDQGLITTVKHFAFNDTELNRMGISVFMSEQRARENELRAFQKGVENKNVIGMMMGMNRAGAYFVGCNPGLMNIVRNEWDFTGLIETDMTSGQADNSRDCIASGVDSMLQAITADKGAAARDELLSKWDGDVEYATGTASDIVTKDTYFLTKVQEALKHMTWVMVNSNVMNGVDNSTHTVRVNTWYDNLFIGLIAGFGVLAVLSLGTETVMTVRKKNENQDKKAEE